MLLQKISQLTLIRESDPFTDTFFEFMLAQFDNIQGVALYKTEQLAIDAVLVPSVFLSRCGDNAMPFKDENFNKILSDVFRQYLANKVKPEEPVHKFGVYTVLIKKSYRDKTAISFLVYVFSEDNSCEHRSGFIPTALLNKKHEPDQLQNIRYLSDIYTNHQNMISLIDIERF